MKIYTDRLWMTALRQLHTVHLRRWWRAGEHLYVVIDMLVQRWANSGYDWPLCSNRSLTECTWSQLDTLHSGHYVSAQFCITRSHGSYKDDISTSSSELERTNLPLSPNSHRFTDSHQILHTCRDCNPGLYWPLFSICNPGIPPGLYRWTEMYQCMQ